MSEEHNIDPFIKCEHGKTRHYCQECEDKVNVGIIYPPCKKCGAKHGMGMKNNVTLKIDPFDLCHKCFCDSNFTLIKIG